MKTTLKKLLVLLLVLAPLPAAAKKTEKPRADKILVEKAARRMTLYQDGKILKTYKISLGKEPVGAKREEGDHKTPEGEYKITGRNANSSFHRSLRVSYPSAGDTKAAKARGVSPGGDIMIHGLPNGLSDFGPTHRVYDWTDGCIAVTDDEIEEIWNLVPNGTKIEILP